MKRGGAELTVSVNVVLGLIVVVNALWLGLWGAKDRSLDDLTERHRNAIELLERVGTERDGFLEVLKGAAITHGPFLSGITPAGEPFLQDAPVEGLYVVIATGCHACATLVPTLAGFAARGGHVVALSMADGPAALGRYSAEHDLKFDLVASPSGALVAMIPEGMTPFSFVVIDGTIEQARLGVFDSSYLSAYW